ncbi:hypothetical protein EYR36_008331 [Pleurotus pulmonarius]|nr:hypothetical protein EYR36_008331 [Pleurotus pulmonarius]
MNSRYFNKSTTLCDTMNNDVDVDSPKFTQATRLTAFETSTQLALTHWIRGKARHTMNWLDSEPVQSAR